MPASPFAISGCNRVYGAAIPVDEILATADRALAIDPQLAEAHAARAFALALGDRRAEAAAAFEQALALDADSHEANRYYAEFSVTDGKFERAAKHFMRALGDQTHRLWRADHADQRFPFAW